MSTCRQLKEYRRHRSKHFREHGNDPRIATQTPALNDPGAKIIHVTNNFAQQCREFEEEIEIKLNPINTTLQQVPPYRTIDSYSKLLECINEPLVILKSDDVFLYDTIEYLGRKLPRYYVSSQKKLGSTYDDLYRFVQFARIESLRGFMSIKVNKGLVQPSFVAPQNGLFSNGSRQKKLLPMSTIHTLITYRKKYMI